MGSSGIRYRWLSVARWGSGRSFIPLLAPKTDASVLAGPLREITALRADSRGQLQQLITGLAKGLSLPEARPEVYTGDVDAILKYSGNAVVPDTASNATRSESSAVSTEEIEILRLLSDSGRVHLETIIEELEAHRTRVQYSPDQSKGGKRVLEWIAMDGDGFEYELDEAGRAYPVENNLLDD